MDMLIRRGDLVDGTGSAKRQADVVVEDGLIKGVERAGSVDPGQAETVIDAAGKLVTPGFVDPHTHYDGQATWDDRLAPSSDHGVTTAVMGNCGVGFAPVRPGGEEFLIALMEGVEDIPGAALADPRRRECGGGCLLYKSNRAPRIDERRSCARHFRRQERNPCAGSSHPSGRLQFASSGSGRVDGGEPRWFPG